MDGQTNVKNVVVVVIDAMRADRVGAIGSERNLTPNIDSLADEGVVFERAFSCINATDPSITSLHTGRYPRTTVLHHADLVTDTEKQRIENAPYVPERLSNAGIRTVATGRPMGRWHRRGFDSYARSVVEAKESVISERLHAINPLLHRAAVSAYNATGALFGSGGPDETNPVEELLTEVDEGRFYGFVHLMDTHAWYDAADDLVDELHETHDYPTGDLKAFFEEYAGSPVVDNVLKPNATEDDYAAGLSRLCARYDATVHEADQKVGQLIAGLKERGFWENTAVFVLSDHGESLVEHGIFFDHHGLYDETTHVPLIGRVPEGESARVSEFVQLHDLAPTLLDLFGCEPIQDTDGRSLIGYLLDESEPPEPRNAVYLEEAHAQRRRAVRTSQHKYIDHVEDDVLDQAWDGDSLMCRYCDRQHGDATELYTLSEDPTEENNVASSRQDVVDEMQSLLAKFEAENSPVTDNDDAVAYDDEEAVLDRLEDLGYR